MTAPTTSPTASVPAPSASVASWLGVLFVLVLVVVVVGGYVRLSGSGLSIPDWPVIRVGTGWTLLPPISEAGWSDVKITYEADQEEKRLQLKQGAGGIGSLGRAWPDLPTFKRMFMIEWGHRFAAALVGLVAAGCLVTVLRRRELRLKIGALFTATCVLLVTQAVIGGMLVQSGTATHWLFVHLGVAAVILCLIVWAILHLLSAERASPEPATYRQRLGLERLTRTAFAVVWVQLVLGALVAGSRGDENNVTGNYQFSSEWPTMMHGRWIPDLWESRLSAQWNLLDNAFLHQWVHRWFAWVVVLALAALYLAAMRSPLGPRLRLSLKVTATFLAVQVVLGLSNVLLAHPTLISLSHLVMGMFLLVSLALVWFDVRHEPADELRPQFAPAPPLGRGAVI